MGGGSGARVFVFIATQRSKGSQAIRYPQAQTHQSILEPTVFVGIFSIYPQNITY
jgi:hypothetical protein